jgi:hypothetical protein
LEVPLGDDDDEDDDDDDDDDEEEGTPAAVRAAAAAAAALAVPAAARSASLATPEGAFDLYGDRGDCRPAVGVGENAAAPLPPPPLPSGPPRALAVGRDPSLESSDTHHRALVLP